jgi:hypothetical protein
MSTTLSKAADYISVPLSYLCSRSMTVAVFPSDLNIQKYKEGEKSCISSYRLISLLTSFSKMFEKVMCKRVNSNNILAGE